MPAETLKCPMCGASVSSDATKCDHCGAGLATVACPSCFGMMFAGQRFCPRCGARADRVALETGKPLQCPRCRAAMNKVSIGNTVLEECPKCEGLWADATSLTQICSDRERQAAVLGIAATLPPEQTGAPELNIRYVPCPVCRKLMNRVNFAKCSNVVVDVCKQHGTWFDKDELRRIVEFIRQGGVDRARERELSELEELRRHAKADQVADAWDLRTDASTGSDPRHAGISAVAGVVHALFD